MSAWSDAVEFATRRARREDSGAVAARQGILGLPCSQTGTKAQRVYETAKKARDDVQRARAARGRSPLEPGTTGNGQWDKELKGEVLQTA